MSHLQPRDARAPTRYLNGPRDVIEFIWAIKGDGLRYKRIRFQTSETIHDGHRVTRLNVAYRRDNRSRGKKSRAILLRAPIVKGDYNPVARIGSRPEPLIMHHPRVITPKPHRSEIIDD